MESANFATWTSVQLGLTSEVKVIPRSNCKCLTFYQQAGGGPSTERHSCLFLIQVFLIFLQVCLFLLDVGHFDEDLLELLVNICLEKRLKDETPKWILNVLMKVSKTDLQTNSSYLAIPVNHVKIM